MGDFQHSIHLHELWTALWGEEMTESDSLKPKAEKGLKARQ